MVKKTHELIYGIHAVESAIRHQPENVLQVFVQQFGRAGIARRILNIKNFIVHR